MMPAPPAPNSTAAPAAGHAEAGQHSAVIADALSTFLQGDRYIALYAPPDGWEGENTSLAEWKEVCKIYPHEFVYTWVRKCHENDSGHLMSMPENRNWPEVRIRIKIPVQDDPTCQVSRIGWICQIDRIVQLVGSIGSVASLGSVGWVGSVGFLLICFMDFLGLRVGA